MVETPVTVPSTGFGPYPFALVIFAHVTQPAWYADYGVFGVNIFFFVTSGFTITLLLCQEEHAAGRIPLGPGYGGFHSLSGTPFLPQGRSYERNNAWKIRGDAFAF